jgi:hypothetical protein
MHTHAHTCTRTRTHAHTRTRTVNLVALPGCGGSVGPFLPSGLDSTCAVSVSGAARVWVWVCALLLATSSQAATGARQPGLVAVSGARAPRKVQQHTRTHTRACVRAR